MKYVGAGLRHSVRGLDPCKVMTNQAAMHLRRWRLYQFKIGLIKQHSHRVTHMRKTNVLLSWLMNQLFLYLTIIHNLLALGFWIASILTLTKDHHKDDFTNLMMQQMNHYLMKIIEMRTFWHLQDINTCLTSTHKLSNTDGWMLLKAVVQTDKSWCFVWRFLERWCNGKIINISGKLMFNTSLWIILLSAEDKWDLGLAQAFSIWIIHFVIVIHFIS